MKTKILCIVILFSIFLLPIYAKADWPVFDVNLMDFIKNYNATCTALKADGVIIDTTIDRECMIDDDCYSIEAKTAANLLISLDVSKNDNKLVFITFSYPPIKNKNDAFLFTCAVKSALKSISISNTSPADRANLAIISDEFADFTINDTWLGYVGTLKYTKAYYNILSNKSDTEINFTVARIK
jgi:hypothetical protein